MNTTLRNDLLHHIEDWLQQYMAADERHTLYMAALNLKVSRKTLYVLRTNPTRISDRTIWRAYERSLQTVIELPE